MLGSSASGATVSTKQVALGRRHEARDVWDRDSKAREWGTCGQRVSFMCPGCSSGLESRNSCGKNYIFKVGLNVFHCWKICHYGHFPPPDSWTAMPSVPSHIAHFSCSLTEVYLFSVLHLPVSLDHVQKKS